jgi:hypothetical protein
MQGEGTAALAPHLTKDIASDRFEASVIREMGA